MKRMCAYIAFMIIALVHVGAQDEKPVLKIYPLEAEGTSLEDARLLESLIHAYFSKHKDIAIVLLSDAEVSEPVSAPTPNYFVKSRLRPDESGYIFEIIIDDNASRELSRQTVKYKSTKDIALNMPNIVNTAFEWRGSMEKTLVAPDTEELVNSDKILGLWNGDKGIKLVRILPNGRAFAFFMSGANMMLSYKIENNKLIIMQVSPNNENFYYPLPLTIAKVLAKEAEPMRWELMLYENESLLKGDIIETTVESEDYEKIVIRHNTVREVEWSRLIR
jgi:hypothetical protein